MPTADAILNLPHLKVKNVINGNPVTIFASCTQKPKCPHCESQSLRKKDKIQRKVKHETLGYRCTLLVIEIFKFKCKNCLKYFNQRIPGILPRFRASQKFKEQLFDLHVHGLTHADMSKRFKTAQSTLERWFHEMYFRENQKLLNRHCPVALGIDEHTFGKGCRFATTFCDLRKNKVFDVVPGKSKVDLADFLKNLKGREKVKIVCIDLSSSFKSLVKEYFPNAILVSDRFHVIRLINHMFLKTCHMLDPSIKNHRGILALLRTRPDRLTPDKLKKRALFFKNQPAIASLYDFKQKIHQLMLKKEQTKKQCRSLIGQLFEIIEKLKTIPFKALNTLAKTLFLWRNEIAAMWRFSKSNGITEGFHRKMKLIQRRAYGFRNFENYRMRVRLLCA